MINQGKKGKLIFGLIIFKVGKRNLGIENTIAIGADLEVFQNLRVIRIAIG